MDASIRTVKENTEAPVVVSNEIGLELNDKKTKCMVMSQDQHAVQNHNIYIYVINPLKRVECLKYFGTSLTNKILFMKKFVQIAVRECLLLFGAESFVFQFAVQKYKGQDI